MNDWKEPKFVLPNPVMLSKNELETILRSMSVKDAVDVITEVLGSDKQVMDEIKKWINEE